MSTTFNLNNHLKTQESSIIDLTRDSGGCCSRCTTIIQIRKEIVEIKKERLRILTALAKSENKVAESDIAIAEYELQTELQKQQKKEDYGSQSRHADTNASAHRTSKKKTQTSKTLETAHRNVSTDQNSNQNSTENPKARKEDVTSKQQPRSETRNIKENCINKPRPSIMVSIPLDKIMQFKNISIPGEHTIPSYQNQKPHNTQKTNTENCTQTSNTHKRTLNGNAVSVQNANVPGEHVSAGRMENSSGNVGDAVDTVEQRKRICISMLKVTSHYQFCLTPDCEECKQKARYGSKPVTTISN